MVKCLQANANILRFHNWTQFLFSTNIKERKTATPDPKVAGTAVF
jgi:hypothetical protein